MSITQLFCRLYRLASRMRCTERLVHPFSAWSAVPSPGESVQAGTPTLMESNAQFLGVRPEADVTFLPS